MGRPKREPPVGVEPGGSEPGGGAAWKYAGLSLSAFLLALLALYAGTYASIVETWWRSETFAHGFIVVPTSAYLVWRRRALLAARTPRPAWLGALALAALGAGWLIGRAADVLALEHICVVLMIPAAVVAFCGVGVARTITFPLAFLLFAAPIGEAAVPALTDFTATFAVLALKLSGVPVATGGWYIMLPGGTWEVGKACSGIRYLIAALALGSLFAYLQYVRLGRRLLFVAVTAVAAIAANGLRAYGIVMLGYLSDMRIATGVDHIIYGWFFFAVLMLCLFWIGRRWAEDPPASRGAQGPGASAASARRVSAATVARVAIAAVAVAAAFPLYAAWMERTASLKHVPPPALAPLAQPPWSGPYDTDDTWVPHYQGPDLEVRKVYLRGDVHVHLFAAYYAHERQGAEIVNFGNRFYDRHVWRRAGEAEREVWINGETRRIWETQLRNGPTHRIVWHWYEVSGRLTDNPYAAKYYLALARLTGTYRGSAVVAVAADDDGTPRGVDEPLRDFLQRMGPRL